MSLPSASNTLGDDALGVEPGLGIHRVRRVLVEEDVGQHHGADLAGRGRARRASASVCSTCEPKPPIEPSSMVISTSCSRARRQDQVACPAAWRSAHRPPSSTARSAASSSAALQRIRRAACRATGCATLLPSRRMRPLPISSGLPSRRQRDADALAARIAQRARAGRRSAPRSPPCASARPRRPAPSARSPAGSRDRRRRTLPAWVGPSAPTSPARSIAKRTGSLWIATSCTTWS